MRSACAQASFAQKEGSREAILAAPRDWLGNWPTSGNDCSAPSEMHEWPSDPDRACAEEWSARSFSLRTCGLQSIVASNCILDKRKDNSRTSHFQLLTSKICIYLILLEDLSSN
ncbi:Hypothetical predicted protein [Podarcis lilfordi]|uniref:Uncharacterized protein n=1 Tax=Podarcis lilfordi TaxID=74358 RepID=A0AA35K9T4_9SAUR|nr:Hypothetical predicted protein [Podarcis lilfordi]